jgi:hypothetical protein
MGVFITITVGLLGFVYTQNKVQVQKEQRFHANRIAEAGLDYYKWHLAHYPDDIYDGEGATSTGPYVHTYEDPESGEVGSFSLEISGNTQCNSIASVDITSTGWVSGAPSRTETVTARYARPSVGEFAYIIDSNVWAGSDREIYGPYHSNGGIRMDGTNYSTVTSGVDDWTCTSSFGCSGDPTVDGVFGAGGDSALWDDPVETVDFVGMTLDFANMQTQAEADGIYLPPSSGWGYHVYFQSDGTIDVYEVDSVHTDSWGYSSLDGWNRDYHIITSESFYGTYNLPSDCSLIFVEDNLWVEGTVKGKATIAAGDTDTVGVDPTVILPGNITYASGTGSGVDGLTVVAEYSVLIPIDSPDDMVLNGIFIAQNGNFGRNFYQIYGYYDVPYAYNDYVERDSLTMNGTIVSNGRVGTKWTCSGSYCSGYADRVNSYDRTLATDPPPLTPYADDEYQFIQWREE